MTPVALSVRQPWAALLVYGLKTIEVRTWPTRRRGPLFIHASKIVDERPEVWELVTTADLRAATEFRGGIVGVVELVGCRTYETAGAFAADWESHRNPAGWFRPPRLYGFVVTGGRPVAFERCVGQTGFFGGEWVVGGGPREAEGVPDASMAGRRLVRPPEG